MNKDNIKAIIFDMDGVIVDSEPIHKKTGIQVFREFGMDVPKSEWDFFRGKKWEDIFSYASQKYGTRPVSIEDILRRKVEVYLDCAAEELKMTEGAYEFLVKLKNSQKYQYALTTSGRKYQQDEILQKFKLSDFFKVMVTAEDVKNGKPDPEPYAITAKKLNENPENCLVIEDSDNGILSAKAAGCLACGITGTFNREKLASAGADMIIDNFAELEIFILANMEKTFDIEFEKAIKFLKEYLGDKENPRKPIVPHCLRVGEYLFNKKYSREVVLGGLLHDTLEFSEISQDLIEKEFGENVARLVLANTKDRKITDSNERIEELAKRCAKQGKEALIIRAADTLDSFKYYTKVNNQSELDYCRKNADAIMKYKPEDLDDEVLDELKKWV